MQAHIRMYVAAYVGMYKHYGLFFFVLPDINFILFPPVVFLPSIRLHTRIGPNSQR